jgi:trigger factor
MKALEDHRVSMIVTLEQSQMEAAKHRAARKISERKTVPGFRPGKAPYDVVIRTFGESVIVEEAVDLLLDEIYPKALDESKLEPGASGSLEKMEDLDKEPKFTFIVPLAPKVELGDYHSIRVPYDWKEPGEDEVEKSLQEMRQMYAKTETVQRPIQLGDFVLIDLKGRKAKETEETAPVVDRKNFPVFIRTDEKADEWPYVGFSNDLIGASPDEEKTVSHKFPKDHTDESLKGHSIKFTATIKMVRSSILPEVNDDFAKQLGPFETVQALRDTLKADLASRSKDEYDDAFYGQVMDAVKAMTVIKYPPQAVDHEAEHVLEDIKSRLAKQGMDLTAYLKSRNLEQEQFIADEVRPTAIKRLERTLLMDAIAGSEKIEVSKEQLDSSFQKTIYDMAGSEDFQKYMKGKNKPPKQLMEALTMESANRAYVQLTLERLKAIATGEFSASTPETSSEPTHSQKKKVSPKAQTGQKKPTQKKPAVKSAGTRPAKAAGSKSATEETK